MDFSSVEHRMRVRALVCHLRGAVPLTRRCAAWERRDEIHVINVNRSATARGCEVTQRAICLSSMLRFRQLSELCWCK